MRIRKILIYKISGGALSLEKEGSIAITTIDEEQDSLELKGLGSLISDLKQNEYIGILISDDTDTPKSDKDEWRMSRADIKEVKEKLGTIKTNLRKAEKLRFK